MVADSHLLSERERQILRLIAKGATNQQIARELVIGVNAVKVHLRNMFRKVGAGSRAQAALYAVRLGVVSLDELPRSTSGGELGAAQEERQAIAATHSFKGPTAASNAGRILQTSRSYHRPRAFPFVGGRIAGFIHTTSFGEPMRLALIGLGAVLCGAVLLLLLPQPLLPLAPSFSSSAVPTAVSAKPKARWPELTGMPSGRARFALAGCTVKGRH